MRWNHRKGMNNATLWHGCQAFGWCWCSVCICIFKFIYAYHSYRNFKWAHHFSSDGLFVNPGNAATTGISISDNRVVVARNHISIVFISNGCVATCNLFVLGTCGSGIHISHVKKIRIWPLNEEFDALTAYFGTIYGISQFYCNFFGDILIFQTQIEKASSSNQSGLSCMFSFFLIGEVN